MVRLIEVIGKELHYYTEEYREYIRTKRKPEYLYKEGFEKLAVLSEKFNKYNLSVLQSIQDVERHYFPVILGYMHRKSLLDRCKELFYKNPELELRCENVECTGCEISKKNIDECIKFYNDLVNGIFELRNKVLKNVYDQLKEMAESGEKLPEEVNTFLLAYAEKEVILEKFEVLLKAEDPRAVIMTTKNFKATFSEHVKKFSDTVYLVKQDTNTGDTEVEKIPAEEV